jgi:hypothetical protein
MIWKVVEGIGYVLVAGTVLLFMFGVWRLLSLVF